jgi:predicted alpha/beta superfamily hydrolase
MVQSNSDLQEKFDVQSYQFSDDFEPTETFDFKGSQTNIDVVAKNLKSIYKNTTYPTVLITDGNQTCNDYVYSFDATL